MAQKKKEFHPDYGYPEAFRLKVCKNAMFMGTTRAARVNNVSSVSIYNWLRVYTCTEVLKGTTKC
jgi:hypothetical protein